MPNNHCRRCESSQPFELWQFARTYSAARLNAHHVVGRLRITQRDALPISAPALTDWLRMILMSCGISKFLQIIAWSGVSGGAPVVSSDPSVGRGIARYRRLMPEMWLSQTSLPQLVLRLRYADQRCVRPLILETTPGAIYSLTRSSS